ncbi:hypothetical protein CBS101457_006218 [Exobasidium rhododendri]|nr:hypothetical protein CBS101457_006218 [Exobasidium rhododendri]
MLLSLRNPRALTSAFKQVPRVPRSYSSQAPEASAKEGHPSNVIATPPLRPLFTPLKGKQLMEEPILNKGSAFTWEERETFNLKHHLPYEYHDLSIQVKRATAQLFSRSEPILQYTFLRSMQDQNQVLFYALLEASLKKTLPIIYTPTVGEAIKGFSRLFRRADGIFLSYPHFKEGGTAYLRDAMTNHGAFSRKDIDLIVVTDGEAILGIGDWGAGGVSICIGKQALYTVGGGIDPNRCFNVVLDAGTNNQALLDDHLYLGWRHKRIVGEEYDSFVDSFVSTAATAFPDALIHFEDFGITNAQRLLEKFRPKYSVFNDDVQGTGAVALAALMSAVKVAGTSLKDQKIVLQGAGTAGMGIINQIVEALIQTEGLTRKEAASRFWLIDRYGLIVQGQENIRENQKEFARTKEEVSQWKSTAKEGGQYTLYDTVAAIHPTVLIGTSTIPDSFTEDVVKEMSKHADRPIILPLSNPTSLCEVKPADAMKWSGGTVLMATGSPFEPVTHPVTHKQVVVAELNNALIFPALGLGTILSKAGKLTDSMIVAGVEALSSLSPSLQDPDAGLLPDLEHVRSVSVKIAAAVMKQAKEEGQAKAEWPENDLEAFILERMWKPVYRPLQHVERVLG